MRNVLTIALCVLLAASCADASPRRWYKNPKWWAGEAVIVGALALDGHSTCRAFAHGYVEGSLLLQGSRSCGNAVEILAVGGAIYTGLHIVLGHVGETEPNKFWRALGYVEVPSVAAGFHGYAAAHNYSLPMRGTLNVTIPSVAEHMRAVGLRP